MKKYEILEHVTDLKIRAFGKDKKELFLNLMVGMYEGARYEKERKTKSEERKISIKSADLPSLLVDFLSELLYLTEVNQEVYDDIQFQKLNDTKLEGTLIGKKLKRMGVLIKGVTYHQLDIHQRPARLASQGEAGGEDGIWEATVLFDI